MYDNYDDTLDGDGAFGEHYMKEMYGGKKLKDLQFDYKDPQQLKQFLTDRGKIIPRRVSGLSAKQQRELTQAIKRARNIALLPYTTIE